MKLTGLLTDFRKWLDGEDAVSRGPLSQQQQLSEWDEFFVKIAREVEAVMKREMFTPPGGATYLPGEYIIYLSKEDDALWQGRKREGLEEGLRNGLTERARELIGDRVLKTDKIALSLGIDGALDRGHIRVQAIWDEDSPKTQVTARKKKPAVSPSLPAAPPGEETEAIAADADRTVVRPRAPLPRAPLFTIAYSSQYEEETIFDAHKNRVEIGRGSKDFFVDLKLDGDQEISRKHAILTRGDNDSYKLECVGRNSIEADGREIQPGEHAEVKAGQMIKIGVYELKIMG
ncbi:MAG TPA: FHA domain-containing protein [Blastocatellia bacterium]|nr:FHA domain-containing protein [Blastocatellia bacterium]